MKLYAVSFAGPKEMCALVLGEVCGDVNIPKHDWDVVFPDVPKPTVKENPIEVFVRICKHTKSKPNYF